MNSTKPQYRTVYESAAQTARRIRKILKDKFPGQKFTVRSQTYAGGCSVSVGWTDGPFEDEVGGQVNFLKAGTFDGMTDSYDYDPPVFEIDGEPVRISGANYIFCDRQRSKEAVARLEAICEKKYGDWKGSMAVEYFRRMHDTELALAGRAQA